MKHLHILKRVARNKNLFMCADPECNWTRRKEFLLGKKFLCPLCRSEYIADAEMLRRKLPHCSDCTQTNKNTKIDRLINPVIKSLPEVELKG